MSGMRAVHIDLISDYSTDAFLQGFRRFMSIRGAPLNVYSDPGSQLEGACNELKQMINGIDKKQTERFWHQ